MNDFLATKIIDDFVMGNMTAQEAWRNIHECRATISDEKFDEISALILEDLVESEMVNDDEEIELENFFQNDDDNYSWLDQCYEDRDYGNGIIFNTED